MALLNDVDLLMLEPAMFTDASGIAIRLQTGTDAAIEGNSLTSASASFDMQGIGAGHVIVVDGSPLEVVMNFGATSIMVTARRESGAALIKPGDGTSLAYEVLTFMPLIEESELWLNRVLGLDPDHPTHPLTSDDVINYEDFASLVALRCIARAFSRAAAEDPENAALRERAELYERLGFELRQQLVAAVDVDGDGVADERRSLAVGTWVRV